MWPRLNEVSHRASVVGDRLSALKSAYGRNPWLLGMDYELAGG